MADGYKYIADTGVILPDTADVLADVQTEFQEALGQDLVLDSETPQGVLIAAETSARVDVLRNNAALANQINPNLAGGVFLDAIYAFTGGERAPAERSVIQGVVLTGQPTRVIPAGVRARTSPGGDLFFSTAAVVLDVNGLGTADFQSVEYGPVAAPVGSLNTIVDGVLGWETVNNAAPAVLGRLRQSDSSLRQLRRKTLALQGVSLVEAITSALNATEGVRSIQFRENVTNAPITIDGVTLVPHSVWAIVDGGTDIDIATALLYNKSNGAGWNGTTTVPVVEPASGQTYDVKFRRATQIPVQIRVTVRQGTAIADPQVIARQAILDYANGLLPDEPGFVVGANVSPFEIAAAVNTGAPGFFVTKVEVARVGQPYSTVELPFLIYEVATVTPSSITVVVT